MGLDFKLPGAFLDELRSDRLGLFDVPRQQPQVADDIDQAGVAAGEFKYAAYSTRVENFALLPGDLQAVADVLAGFLFAQRLDVVVQRDALPQGAVLPFEQGVIELVLTHEENVEQLGFLLLDVL